MASIRLLKKEVDNQIFSIIADCLLYSGLYPENKSEEVSDIIEEAVSLRNDLFARINSKDGKGEHAAVKKHYALLMNDLAEGTDKLCQRLSAVSKKKKK
jgi:hypothetical protein